MKMINFIFLLILLSLCAKANSWNLIYNDEIPNFENRDSLSNILKVCASKTGKVYFVASTSHSFDYYIYKLENGIIKRISSAENYPIPMRSRIWDLAIDKDDNLLAATEFGLLKWDGSAWSRYIIDDELSQTRVIMKIIEYNNKLYLGANSFHISYTDSTHYIKIEIDRQRVEVLTFENDILNLKHQFELPKNSYKFISDFCVESDNSFWFACSDRIDGGIINIRDGSYIEVDIFKHLDYSKVINARNILYHNNKLYIGVNQNKHKNSNKSTACILVYDIAIEGVEPIYLTANEDKNRPIYFTAIKDYENKIIVSDLSWGVFLLRNSHNGKDVIDYQSFIDHPLLTDFFKQFLTSAYDFDYVNGTLYIATSVGLVYGKYDLPDTTANSIEHSSLNGRGLKIFPNVLSDASQYITMTSDYINIHKISIYDMAGNIIIPDLGFAGILAGECNLFIPKLASGKYYLIFKTDTGHLVSPILITN